MGYSPARYLVSPATWQAAWGKPARSLVPGPLRPPANFPETGAGRFRVSGFGFRVSGFGFMVSGFGFRVYD
jgi:hypothetical protein